MVHLQHGGTKFPHTESAPAANSSYTMQFSWLAPRERNAAWPLISSSAAYLLMGSFPQWRTFVPAAHAASVHPCAHSAGRAGFGYPFPSMSAPAPKGVAATGYIGSTDCLFTCRRHSNFHRNAAAFQTGKPIHFSGTMGAIMMDTLLFCKGEFVSRSDTMQEAYFLFLPKTP